jgi:hypothetical protein
MGYAGAEKEERALGGVTPTCPSSGLSDHGGFILSLTPARLCGS